MKKILGIYLLLVFILIPTILLAQATPTKIKYNLDGKRYLVKIPIEETGKYNVRSWTAGFATLALSQMGTNVSGTITYPVFAEKNGVMGYSIEVIPLAFGDSEDRSLSFDFSSSDKVSVTAKIKNKGNVLKGKATDGQALVMFPAYTCEDMFKVSGLYIGKLQEGVGIAATSSADIAISVLFYKDKTTVHVLYVDELQGKYVSVIGNGEYHPQTGQIEAKLTNLIGDDVELNGKILGYKMTFNVMINKLFKTGSATYYDIKPGKKLKVKRPTTKSINADFTQFVTFKTKNIHPSASVRVVANPEPDQDSPEIYMDYYSFDSKGVLTISMNVFPKYKGSFYLEVTNPDGQMAKSKTIKIKN